MPKQPNRPCSEIAMILVINALLRAKAKKRDTDYYWITKKTYRRISRRDNIQDAHILKASGELGKLGWCIAVLPRDQGYAILRVEPIIDGWPKLATKRLRSEKVLQMNGDELEEFYDSFMDGGEGLEPFDESEFDEEP